MSDPRLLAEMLDHVADHLHNRETALRNCCLVSKSWVPRTREHLFADIGFSTAKSLEAWKETFPDPSASPARYTKILSVGCAHVVITADVEKGGWIGGFSRVVHLVVASSARYPDPNQPGISLAPFHGLSIITHHQISPRDCSPPSVIAHFWPHPFNSSSRGLGCDHFLRDTDRQR